MDKFIVEESMKMEISKEEYKHLIKIEEKYTLLEYSQVDKAVVAQIVV